MLIRYMTDSDVPSAAEIERTLFSDPWTELSFLESLKRPEALFLVAEDESGHICGYCGAYVSLFEADIVNVGVEKASGGRGIGFSLVTELVKKLKDKGISDVFLEVRKSNEPAKRIYEKAGFEPLYIRKNFYDDPKEDAIIMKRSE